MGNNLPDQLLVETVLHGDTGAFGQIIKNTEGLVAQIVFKMISNPEDRKDISQDIYLKAFHNLSGFKFQSKLSTWIGQIAYNTCLSWLEKKKFLLPGNLFEPNNQEEFLEIQSMDIVANDTEITIQKKEISDMLRVATERLTPIYKTLITLYHQEELSYDEIAQITQLPQGTVKNYLFRARKALKEIILSTYKKEEI
jgi:RNA polymerase sigma-70 factor (ECF subfamily)